MCKKNNCVVVTTPLQYINYRNIKNIGLVDLYVIPPNTAKEYFLKILNHEESVKMRRGLFVFSNRFSLFAKLVLNRGKYENLYLDSDFGLMITFFLFFLRKKRIFTYEEGYGSYREIITNSSKHPLLKIKFHKAIGNKNWIGGGRFTYGSILYKPKIFLDLVKPKIKEKLNLFTFERDFHVNLKYLKELEVFGEIELDFGKPILIYLTSWEFNDEVYKYLKKYKHFHKVIKPHPHFISTEDIYKDFDSVIESSLPSELLFLEAKRLPHKVIILHENSSSILYLNSVNFEIINLNRNQKIYNLILESFLKSQ